MNGDSSKLLGMTFKREFGVGDILQIALLLLAIIGAYYNLSARIDLVELALTNHVSNTETHESHIQKDARFYPRGELDAKLDSWERVEDYRFAEINEKLELIRVDIAALESEFKKYINGRKP